MKVRGGVTCGHDYRMRLGINCSFGFCITRSAVYRVEQKIIIITVLFPGYKFSFAAESALFYIEGKDSAREPEGMARTPYSVGKFLFGDCIKIPPLK